MNHVIFFAAGDTMRAVYGERISHLILAVGKDGYAELEQTYIREHLLNRLERHAIVHVFSFSGSEYLYRNEFVDALHLPEVGIDLGT